MATHRLKRGDTVPLLVRLVRGDSTPIPLAGATVRFRMNGAVAGLPSLDQPATVLEGQLNADGMPYSTGTVEYAWRVGDTDVVGLYRCTFQITDAAGKVETVPSEGYLSVQIEPV